MPEAHFQIYLDSQKRLEAQLGLGGLKVVDSQKRLEAQLGLGGLKVVDSQKRLEAQLGLGGLKAVDYINYLDDLSKQQRLLIKQAIMPLPNLATQIDVINQGIVSQARAAIENINRAIAGAKYIATLELTEENEDSLYSEEDEELAEQIIDVVTEEVFTQLQRVDFLPLRALDEVVRNPEAMTALNARDFERFIATLIEQLGFEDVILTPRSGDRGRDVLATKRIHGISIMFAFECKRYKAPVDPDIMRALLGTIVHRDSRANKGVLVTTSNFSAAARQFILTEPALDGRDFDGIVEWLNEYSSRT